MYPGKGNDIQVNGSPSLDENDDRNPKDARIIISIMRSLSINNYEPICVNILLEYINRYVGFLIDETLRFTNHAKREHVDISDVRLGAFMTLEQAFTPPPPQDALLELARGKQNHTIPPYRPTNELCLPPGYHQQKHMNYKLRAVDVPKTLTKSALDQSTANCSLPRLPSMRRQNISRIITIKKGNRVMCPKPNMYEEPGESSTDDESDGDLGEPVLIRRIDDDYDEARTTNGYNTPTANYSPGQIPQHPRLHQRHPFGSILSQQRPVSSNRGVSYPAARNTSKGTSNGEPYVENVANVLSK